MTRTQLMTMSAGLRDRIMARVWRQIEKGRPLEVLCWAVIAAAALYFSPALAHLLGFEITIRDVVAVIVAGF